MKTTSSARILLCIGSLTLLCASGCGSSANVASHVAAMAMGHSRQALRFR